MVLVLTDERLTLASLAEKTGIARTTLDRIVERLERQGWLTKVTAGSERFGLGYVLKIILSNFLI